MKFKDLSKIIFSGLKPKLQKSKALAIFARERNKFEGWLKVEVCEILSSKGFKDVVPERNRIDVTFENWAIELKTPSTNYDRNDKSSRPITDKIESIIKEKRHIKHKQRSKDSSDSAKKTSIMSLIHLKHFRPSALSSRSGIPGHWPSSPEMRPMDD